MRKQPLHPRTAVINQKQKNQSKKARLDALQWLASKFPEAFDNSVCIRPLNLGIMTDILAIADEALKEGISKSKLREAVVLFTRRLDYLTCLKAREMRIDLYGNPKEMVTEEDAERAAAKIKRRIEQSVKNARKTVSPVVATKSSSSKITPPTPQTTGFMPHYPERPPAFSAQSGFTPATRTSTVTVTHKQSRSFDPDAVLRLKEKLGLTRKQEETET